MGEHLRIQVQLIPNSDQLSSTHPVHTSTDSPGPSNRLCSSKLVMLHHVTANQSPCPPQASCREDGHKRLLSRHLQMNQICSVILIYVPVSEVTSNINNEREKERKGEREKSLVLGGQILARVWLRKNNQSLR